MANTGVTLVYSNILSRGSLWEVKWASALSWGHVAYYNLMACNRPWPNRTATSSSSLTQALDLFIVVEFKLALVLMENYEVSRNTKETTWQKKLKWHKFYVVIPCKELYSNVLTCMFNNFVVVVVWFFSPCMQMVDGWALGGVYEIYVYNAASMWQNRSFSMHKILQVLSVSFADGKL